MVGTLKSLPENGTKSYGFIRSQNTEFFFHRNDFDGHWNDLVTDLNNGIEIKLKFEPVESNRGARAASVTRLNSQSDFIESLSME